MSTATPAPEPKTINFAILYGISRWGLAKRLEVDPDEAQDMISRYFESFPGINQYISTTLQAARESGHTETPVWPQNMVRAPKIRQSNGTSRQRTGRNQRAHPRHQRRHHQTRDGENAASTCGCWVGASQNADASA